MKTLVTGALGASGEQLDMLRAVGLEIVLHPDERKPVEHPEEFEAVICNGLFLYNDISEFTGLKFVQLTSAGTDRVPEEYIKSHGIELCNAAGVYSAPMAEWTIMRILELYKNAARLYKNQGLRHWEKDRSWRELSGKTACIVGYGEYGAQTAKRLKAFDVYVLAVNRTVKKSAWADEFYPLEKLDSCLQRADIVILAAALTEKTRNLMNSTRLNSMKSGAIIINAARGGLVDEAALLAALESGQLAGAALDVFESEPVSDSSRLWDTPNLIISPHNSFVGEWNKKRLFELIIKNMGGKSLI